jgi:hypothetical protein
MELTVELELWLYFHCKYGSPVPGVDEVYVWVIARTNEQISDRIPTSCQIQNGPLACAQGSDGLSGLPAPSQVSEQPGVGERNVKANPFSPDGRYRKR